MGKTGQNWEKQVYKTVEVFYILVHLHLTF